MQRSFKVHPETCCIPINFYSPTSPKPSKSEKSSPTSNLLSFQSFQNHPRSAEHILNSRHSKDFPSISTFTISDSQKDEIFFESLKISSKTFKPSLKKVSFSQNLSIKTCRICLDSDLSSDFISPCKCRGFQKWVHQECLKVWLVKSERFEKRKVFCEVCKNEFLMEFQYERFCAPCNEMSCRTWLPIVIAIIMFCFIGCFVVQGYIDQSVRGLVVFAVSVIFGIVGVVSLGIGIANARAACVERRVCSWKVLSR
jgi:hypothetical protein